MGEKRRTIRYELVGDDFHTVSRAASTGDLRGNLHHQNLRFDEDSAPSSAPSELWGGGTQVRGNLEPSHCVYKANKHL